MDQLNNELNHPEPMLPEVYQVFVRQPMPAQAPIVALQGHLIHRPIAVHPDPVEVERVREHMHARNLQQAILQFLQPRRLVIEDGEYVGARIQQIQMEREEQEINIEMEPEELEPEVKKYYPKKMERCGRGRD